MPNTTFDRWIALLLTGGHSKIAEKNTFGDVNAANEIVIDDETILLHMLHIPLQTRCQCLSGFSI
jgi:hypothetical protein